MIFNSNKYLVLLLLIFILSCSTSKKTYSVSDCQSHQSLESHIISKNELIGIQDTITVFLSGLIIENLKPKDFIKLDFINTSTNKVYKANTDFEGEYELIVDKGSYKLSAYGKKFGNLIFKSGEIRKINIELEVNEYYETIEYEFKSKKELNKFKNKMK